MELDPDIAAAMGFASFGASKKRKHNADDAFTEAAEAKQPITSSTGANATELGVRAQDPTADVPQTATSTGEAAAAGTFDQDMQPQTGETAQSAKKPKPEQRAVPTGLAAFLSRGQSLPEKPAAESSSNDTGSALPSRPSLPAKPTAPDVPDPGQSGEDDLHALRRGVRDARGDLAYYLPSFVKDPWSDLAPSYA